MISIIICSRDKNALHSISLNVKATIGLPYEIIAINNTDGKYSIFSAYNIGIRKSKYDVLCFMHEDIAFETKNWGQKVLDIFNSNAKLGLLGVAGSSYKSAVPSGWVFETTYDKIVNINVIQHNNLGDSSHLFNNPSNVNLAKVASVDGLWFCTPKVIAVGIGFDEITFDNFHCYDIDYSLSVLQQYDVAVTFEILINHFSLGTLNDKWITETLKLHDKWRHILPVNLQKISKIDLSQLEFEAFHAILPKLKGKRKIAFDFAQFILKSKVVKLVGARRFITMFLVVVKKGFE